MLLQAVSLIASYLEVPLRYPLRLGGSRSYINDYAPCIELPSSESFSNSLPNTNLKPIEFPLFLEGQDTTRAAYAVFLLNKVCFLFICHPCSLCYSNFERNKELCCMCYSSFCCRSFKGVIYAALSIFFL